MYLLIFQAIIITWITIWSSFTYNFWWIWSPFWIFSFYWKFIIFLFQCNWLNPFSKTSCIFKRCYFWIQCISKFYFFLAFLIIYIFKNFTFWLKSFFQGFNFCSIYFIDLKWSWSCIWRAIRLAEIALNLFNSWRWNILIIKHIINFELFLILL